MYVCMYVCILARHVRSKRTVDGEGGSSERCGVVRVGTSLRDLSKNILKQGVGKCESCS